MRKGLIAFMIGIILYYPIIWIILVIRIFIYRSDPFAYLAEIVELIVFGSLILAFAAIIYCVYVLVKSREESEKANRIVSRILLVISLLILISGFSSLFSFNFFQPKPDDYTIWFDISDRKDSLEVPGALPDGYQYQYTEGGFVQGFGLEGNDPGPHCSVREGLDYECQSVMFHYIYAAPFECGQEITGAESDLEINPPMITIEQFIPPPSAKDIHCLPSRSCAFAFNSSKGEVYRQLNTYIVNDQKNLIQVKWTRARYAYGSSSGPCPDEPFRDIDAMVKSIIESLRPVKQEEISSLKTCATASTEQKISPSERCNSYFRRI
jgi:hypothetical protein